MTKPGKLPYQSFVDGFGSGPVASVLYVVRCTGLILCNMMIIQCVGVAGMMAQFMGVPMLTSALTATVLLLGCVAYQVTQTPSPGLGARASRGDGKPENSLEALRDLMATPEGGGSSSYADPSFRFLEVSVQETADNRLVMLHPLTEKAMKRAFPRTAGANAQVFETLEREMATNVEKLTAAGLSLAQLQSLSYYGSEGVHVATLEEYLGECKKLKMRKPVALELRHVYSDKARAGLVRIVSSHQEEAEEGEAFYTGLGGSVSIVADPSRFTKCFGEFGTVFAILILRL